MPDDPIRHWDTLTAVEAAALAARDPVIVLPTAAIEQHGPHLPLSTDLALGLGLLAEAFRRLPRDLPAWALPPQAVGASGEHRRFAGTLSLTPELLIESLVQTGAAVAAAGVRRLVVSNSHGGNLSAIDIAARRLREEHDLLVVKTSYFDGPRPADAGLPDEEWRYGLHGGAVETAMMRHLRPDLVRLDAVRRFPSLDEDLSAALRQVSAEGGAAFAWLADDLNREGVAGDATLGSAELGARLVAHYGQALAEVIEDARRFPLDRLIRRSPPCRPDSGSAPTGAA